MKITEFFFKNHLIMAPVAGFTNAGFRAVALRSGAGLAYTEMVSAKGLLYNNEATKALLYTTDAEEYPAIQLFGNEPDILYRAAASEDLKKFRFIDVNMGCPVPKIVKNGEGSALLTNPALITEIIGAVRAAAPDKFVSAKIRIGVDDAHVNAVAVAEAVEKGGADFVTVHGRTRAMQYSGTVNYDAIKEVKKNVGIPVVGNGDIRDFKSYLRMLTYTDCDAVMLARGALADPSLFSELLQEDAPLTKSQMTEIMIDTMLEVQPERIVLNNMKKQVAYLCRGMRNSKEIKLAAYYAQSTDELKKLFK